MYDDRGDRGRGRHGGGRGGGRGGYRRDDRRGGMPLSELDPELTDMSRKVIGCAIEVHKALGPGYPVEVYVNALKGELDSELRDGRKFKLTEGMSYEVSDFGDAAHRSSTVTGATLFIVD